MVWAARLYRAAALSTTTWHLSRYKLRLACLTDQTTHMSQQASSAKLILNQYAPA